MSRLLLALVGRGLKLAVALAAAVLALGAIELLSGQAPDELL